MLAMNDKMYGKKSEKKRIKCTIFKSKVVFAEHCDVCQKPTVLQSILLDLSQTKAAKQP